MRTDVSEIHILASGQVNSHSGNRPRLRQAHYYTAKERGDVENIYRIAVAGAGSEQALQEKPFLLLYAEPISLGLPHLSSKDIKQVLLIPGSLLALAFEATAFG
jgi:hypothetical protein